MAKLLKLNGKKRLQRSDTDEAFSTAATEDEELFDSDSNLNANHQQNGTK
jgi:hypothetical protein